MNTTSVTQAHRLIPTLANCHWRTGSRPRTRYFRLYAPTEAYFDRSWPLTDIEKAK